jgi:hypothetical protein
MLDIIPGSDHLLVTSQRLRERAVCFTAEHPTPPESFGRDRGDDGSKAAGSEAGWPNPSDRTGLYSGGLALANFASLRKASDRTFKLYRLLMLEKFLSLDAPVFGPCDVSRLRGDYWPTTPCALVRVPQLSLAAIVVACHLRRAVFLKKVRAGTLRELPLPSVLRTATRDLVEEIGRFCIHSHAWRSQGSLFRIY